MRTRLLLFVLAAVVFPMIASADSGVSGSLLLHSPFEVSAPAETPDAPTTGAALARAASALTTPLADGVHFRPRAYRPRVVRARPRRSPGPAMPVAAQLHIGFFTPLDNFSTGFDGGFRLGPQVNPHMQVGLAMDWWRRFDNTVLDLGPVKAPGGTASEELILSESTANLVPILVFVQLNGGENMPFIPYAGFGVGYEWLSLRARDYLTHESFDQTFGGFGWQTWAGASLPLDRRTYLNAEVFLNACKVGSDVDVYIEDYGSVTVRDVIKMNGVGMRFGVSWRF